jgi:hypothetical protein
MQQKLSKIIKNKNRQTPLKTMKHIQKQSSMIQKPSKTSGFLQISPPKPVQPPSRICMTPGTPWTMTLGAETGNVWGMDPPENIDI